MKKTRNYCNHTRIKKNYPLYDTIDAKVVYDIIEYSTNKYPERPVFQIPVPGKDDLFITYRQFADHIEGLGTYILSKGLKNEKIAVIGENSYEWLLAYFAILGSGNTAVPLDRDLPIDDLLYNVKNSECKAVFFSKVYRDVAEKFREQDSGIEMYFPKAEIYDLIAEGRKLMEAGDNSFKAAEVKPDDLAAIVYTSGTTGKSKGVMLTQRNITSNAISACRNIDGEGQGVLALPLHHTFGMVANLLAPLIFGARIYMTTSIRNIQADMVKIGATAAFCVPLMAELIYKKVWATAKEKGKDEILKKGIKISNTLLKLGIDVRRKLFAEVHEALGGNLELFVCGGAPLSEKMAFELTSMGINILNGYGITECSPIVSVNRNFANKIGSVGLVLDCNEVKINNPDENGVGEIYVRGDNVMIGYYNDEAATKEAFDNGWFKTGDLGYFDKDGFLYITGRIKNLIILSNGKNVSAEELEEKILDEISYVEEVIVYDDNDKLAAEIFLDEASEPEAKSKIKKDIKSLNIKLPSYKKIAKTKIRDEAFPKTTSMKIKRNYNRKG
ncbi:MAG: AMP-binding protein [Clostridia bacterium]|nr:AMP-binding protein [Clostridia bacterium]